MRNYNQHVYVDCDGVLADFDSHFEDKFGLTSQHYEDAHGTKKFWGDIQYLGTFFLDLPLMPDAKALMNYLDYWNIRPIILTGCPMGTWSQPQKLAWAKKHFPGTPMITCRSREKALYCREGDVLIDDITKYKHIWEAAGGTYIVHTSAENTMEELERIGLVDTFGL